MTEETTAPARQGQYKLNRVILAVEQLGVGKVTAFLQSLETDRQNQVSSRNVRLSAIHSFFRYLGGCSPQHLEQAQRILSIPFKRAGSREIQYLEFDEIQAVLQAVDTEVGNGCRDLALLSLVLTLVPGLVKSLGCKPPICV